MGDVVGLVGRTPEILELSQRGLDLELEADRLLVDALLEHSDIPGCLL